MYVNVFIYAKLVKDDQDHNVKVSANFGCAVRKFAHKNEFLVNLSVLKSLDFDKSTRKRKKV